MVTAHIRENGRIVQKTVSLGEEFPPLESILWIDLLLPKVEEIKRIENVFNVELPTKYEREEIEFSSRYWEDDESIMVNAYFFVSFFFVDAAKASYNETVSFVLKDEILFTVRDRELQTFDMTQKAILSRPREFISGYEIFMQIFDIRIDSDADLLEYASRESDRIRKTLLWDPSGQGMDTLRQISTMQEFTLKVRQSVFDKQRILNSMARSSKLSKPLREDLAIMMKDVNSLVEFTTITINTLDNLQNLFLAQINIEQNKIIKLFTVASVALMPPTLIASIYGMNFRHMPELSWGGGYPMSIAMMIVAGAIPLAYFKKKKWL
ncbi:MAG: magnesium/cobalt transporter CorA [Sulfuricurvum sp.]